MRKLAASGLMLALMSSTALAQAPAPQQDITKVTCGDIAALPPANQAALVYYAAGYTDGRNSKAAEAAPVPNAAPVATTPAGTAVGGLTLDAQTVLAGCGASANALLVNIIVGGGGSAPTAGAGTAAVPGVAGTSSAAPAVSTTLAPDAASAPGTASQPAGTNSLTPGVDSSTGVGVTTTTDNSGAGAMTEANPATSNSVGTGSAGGTPGATTTTGSDAVQSDLNGAAQQNGANINANRQAPISATTGLGTTTVAPAAPTSP
jgi:hypothetical protein